MRAGDRDAARTDGKPGDLVRDDLRLELAAEPKFVSRGGEKLEAALDAFAIDPHGWVCLDVGASTGGFTDCLLRRGAARVYALDVGRGQLAESLRRDPRVVSMERTHAGRLDPADARALSLPEPMDLGVIDVSFISLTRILRGVYASVRPGGHVVPLVKPQFEVAASAAPKGVVRDPVARRAAIVTVAAHAAGLGFELRGEIESPLVGPAGNHEFLLHLVRPA